MHAQGFDVFPETGARLRFGGEARERIQQRTVFRRFLVEKAVRPGERSKGESNNIEKQDKGEFDDPPECFERVSHFYPCHLQWVQQLRDLPDRRQTAPVYLRL